MCGICGAVWTDSGRGPSDEQLAGMVARLEHRGPDENGSYRDRHAALGFRRLSILDLPGGSQPLPNEDGSIRVVFNGEIYNFPELRRRLEATGHTLRSTGDTEVLPHLYEDEGPGFVRRLRGMFAIALWDAPRRRLVLARDRLGQKPLVYRLEPDRLLFASELKALLSLPEADAPRTVDPLAVDQYLTYGYVPHPRTILQGVHKLPPAHLAVWQDGRLRLQRYWEPDWDVERDRPEAEEIEELRGLLSEAVREQMASDVPLGAFLSGGIDSTIIVGLMQSHSSQRVKTFSIGFDDPAFDERSYAALAAERLGTDHHEFVVRPAAWETLPSLARQFDEPFADSSALPTWHVAERTRSQVTVALTGDAGDELFGGYDRYRAVALAERLAAGTGALGRGIGEPLAKRWPASSRAKTRSRAIKRFLEAVWKTPADRYLSWMTSFDEPTRATLYTDAFLDQLAAEAQKRPEEADPADLLRRAWNVGSKRDRVTQAMIADLLTYLPGDLLVKVDQASMAHSLECRGPFLDHRVVEFALALPLSRKLGLRPGRSKRILKRAFSDRLPAPIRHRPKMGFGVPIDRWLRGPLSEELRAVLLDPASLKRGLFQAESVERLVEEHIAGRADHAYRLWALLMLELWFRHHHDEASRASASTLAAPSA